LAPVELSRLDALMRARNYVELERHACQLLTRVPQSGVAWKALSLAVALQGKDALRAFTQAARLLPNDVEAHANLGNALQRAGRPEDAVESCRRALKINPYYVNAHLNLGRALADLGQFEKAAMSYHDAIAIKPDHAEAHLQLGNMLLWLGRLHEAAESFRQACELQPTNAIGHFNRGVVARQLGFLDEAVLHYRRALAVKPDYAAAYSNLALIFRQQGKSEEAASCCLKTLKIEPDNTMTLIALSELRADLGDFAEAENWLKRALVVDPTSPVALAGLARMRKMTTADAAWLADAERIADSPLPPREEAYLRYAIGKYFDDVGQFEQAFSHFKRANELAVRYTPAHDRQELTAYIDTIIRLFDAAWYRRMEPYAHPSARPVFVIGTPRSGTTLAEQILASHPSVHGAGELTYWKGASSTHLAAAASREDCGAVIGRFSREYLQILEELASGAPRVVDKMPANFLFLGLINALLPNARIIHMRRHPIDTCLSIYFQNFETTHFYANDLGDLAHYYQEYRRLMAHWRTILPASAILDVPYESLVRDPIEWSRQMIEFIGLPWDSHCADSHLTRRPVLTSSRWQVRQPINTSAVGRWRNYRAFLGPLVQLTG